MAARWLLILVAITALVAPRCIAPAPVDAQGGKMTWNVPADYAGVQGENNWYYYQVQAGQYKPLV